MEEPTKEGGLLDLALSNKERLIGDVMAEDSLTNSDHKIMEFRILWGGSRAINKIATLGFWTANFGLLGDHLGRIPWPWVLERRGVQESSLIFKGHFLQAQEWCIPIDKKLSKECRWAAWINKELLKKNQTQAAGVREMEEGTDHLWLIQRHCQSIQKWDEEGQGLSGIKLG